MEVTDLAAQVRKEHKKGRRAVYGKKGWSRLFFMDVPPGIFY